MNRVDIVVTCQKFASIGVRGDLVFPELAGAMAQGGDSN